MGAESPELQNVEVIALPVIHPGKPGQAIFRALPKVPAVGTCGVREEVVGTVHAVPTAERENKPRFYPTRERGWDPSGGEL